MTEAIRHSWLHLRVPLWALMMLPVACSPVFLWLAMRDREPVRAPAERREREYRWTESPLESKFQPEDGARVSREDDLVKLAFIGRPDPDGMIHGTSSWLTPDGTIHNEWHSGGDAGSGEWLASAAGSARLPTLLRGLPPSDPATGPTNCVLVAFPVKGRWVVRTYSRHPVPKEVEELARVVGFWRS